MKLVQDDGNDWPCTGSIVIGSGTIDSDVSLSLSCADGSTIGFSGLGWGLMFGVAGSHSGSGDFYRDPNTIDGDGWRWECNAVSVGGGYAQFSAWDSEGNKVLDFAAPVGGVIAGACGSTSDGTFSH